MVFAPATTCSRRSTTVLDGRGLSAGELLGNATATPFLASSRLVIVEGLLAALGEIKGGRRTKKNAADDPMEPWRRAAATLGDPATMPDTTTLVFVEGDLKKTNAAFSLFAPIAHTVEYGPLAKDELPTWIDARAREKGVKLAPRAMASLAQLIGPDLWSHRERTRQAGGVRGRRVGRAGDGRGGRDAGAGNAGSGT